MNGLAVVPPKRNGEMKSQGCAVWSSARWPGGAGPRRAGKGGGERGSAGPWCVRAVLRAQSMARGLTGRRASRGDFGYGNPQPWAANYRCLGFD